MPYVHSAYAYIRGIHHIHHNDPTTSQQTLITLTLLVEIWFNLPFFKQL
jgi:hypothetical protein